MSGIRSEQMKATGVTAASYGDASHTITLTVDAAGRLTAISTNALGTAAAANTGTSGHTLGFLDGDNTFSGVETFSSQLVLSGTLTPTALSGDVNDYSPTGLATALDLRIDPNGATRNITGLAGGADGRVIILTNISLAWSFVLNSGSTGSTAANRFLLPGDVTVPPNATVALRYDGTSSRWRPFGRTLANTAVTAGTYGSASQSLTVTVGADGRLTGLAAQSIAVAKSQVSSTGTWSAAEIPDLSGTYSVKAGNTSLVTVGTVATGTWQGTKVGLAYGGTNADLSATGGSGQYLKQSSGGAAVTVGTIAAADYPAFVAAGASHAQGAVPDPGATAYTNTQRALLSSAAFAVVKGQPLGFLFTSTDESTSSTTYASLTTPDKVTINLDATQDVYVLYLAYQYATTAGWGGYQEVYLDGTGQTATETSASIISAGINQASFIFCKLSSLASGSHDIEIKHHTGGAGQTIHWDGRALYVFLAG